MARLRGRAKRDHQVTGRVPWRHRKILTFVAGLRYDGITAPFVIDRATTKVILLQYLRNCLVSTLQPGDVVVMDNLPAHKGDDVEAATLSHGLLTDCYPIEQAIAKSKHICANH